MSCDLRITSLQINGMQGQALADRQETEIYLSVDGGAETMRLLLMQGETVCWDTGVIPWKPYSYVILPLEGKRTYRLAAFVQNESAGDRAELELRTGLMGERWKAGWIEPEQEDGVMEREIRFFEQFVPLPDHFGGHDRLRPVQELRRTFSLQELPRQGTLYASAHGVYALWLNGNRVDSRRLAPETTPYENLLYYQIYDLTDMLHEGENDLRVLLADGWWIGRIGLTGDSCQYGKRLGFLGQLELRYADDPAEWILTDESWQSRPSCIKYSDLMMGEKWDLSAERAPWTACMAVGEANETLALQAVEPIEVWNELVPISLATTPNGELVADFGQCLAGVVKICLSCPAGRVVTLDHSETLDTDGNFFRNILGRNKDQQDMVVCGDGETCFCPEFTYHGFRYVRISGASRDEVKTVRALAVGTPIRQIGHFRCSHQGFNQLQHNICWSTRSNMVSVPTDCPQREKVGWTGDIQAFLNTGCFNFDLRGFISAWLGQMRLSQAEDGGVPIVIPSYPEQTKMQTKTFGNNTSAAWSDACVLVPLRIYRAYGDVRVLRDNLDMMEKWMGFIDHAAHDHLWTDGYHFGDWLIPSYQNDIEGGTAATAKVIAACQYAVTTDAFIKVLEALGEPEHKIEKFRALLGSIRRAVRAAFVHENGTVEGDLQGLYVMVLYSGAAQGELGEKVAARLAEKIRANGGALDTGFVSTPHLLDVLTGNGYRDLAWELLLRTESPSWLYQVEHGATSIWENWNAIRPDGTVTTSSYNHYAFGCVGDWIYRSIGGLRPTGAGWREIEISPDFSCGLEWAECSHETPYGMVSCCWKRCGETIRVDVEIPVGVSARLKLPGLDRKMDAGTHSVSCKL